MDSKIEDIRKISKEIDSEVEKLPTLEEYHNAIEATWKNEKKSLPLFTVVKPFVKKLEEMLNIIGIKDIKEDYWDGNYYLEFDPSTSPYSKSKKSKLAIIGFGFFYGMDYFSYDKPEFIVYYEENPLDVENFYAENWREALKELFNIQFDGKIYQTTLDGPDGI